MTCRAARRKPTWPRWQCRCGEAILAQCQSSPVGKSWGMITDRDICMAAATKHRDPANIRVKELFSGHVYGCSADTDVREALKIMQQKQVRRLPIISPEDGRLEGILSMNDLALKATTERKAELSAEDVENTLRAICTHRAKPPLQAGQQLATQIAAV